MRRPMGEIREMHGVPVIYLQPAQRAFICTGGPLFTMNPLTIYVS